MLRCMKTFGFFTFLYAAKVAQLFDPVWGSAFFKVDPQDEDIGEENQGYNNHGNLQVNAKDW